MSCYLFRDPAVAVVYVHVPGDKEHQDHAQKFVESYIRCPPGYKHRTIIITQKQKPQGYMIQLATMLPSVSWFMHDDSGWDNGAHIAVAKEIKDDMMVCFGGKSFVRQKGWLARMVEAWKKHGPGLYGSLASYETNPHINTTGFWCPPWMLECYPNPVNNKEERYEFEHGGNSLTSMVMKEGLPVKLVTWDGEYDVDKWRTPPNIFRRGDQSNCLTYFNHSLLYESGTEEQKRYLEAKADTLN